MKCPTCGAWSNVLETRNGPHESMRRRRECANGHRFITLEVLPTVIHQDAKLSTARAVAKRRELWQRDQRIKIDQRVHSTIAAEYGITRSQVVRIKRGIRH